MCVLIFHITIIGYQCSGGSSEGGTPVPISNTEVKSFHADGTIPSQVWESRSPPEHWYPVFIEKPLHFEWFFILSLARFYPMDHEIKKSSHTSFEIWDLEFLAIKLIIGYWPLILCASFEIWNLGFGISCNSNWLLNIENWLLFPVWNLKLEISCD